MCWSSRIDPVINTAKKDIIVYKTMMRRTKKDKENNRCCSNVMEFKYKFNVLYRLRKKLIVVKDYYMWFSIYEGFHSYAYIPRTFGGRSKLTHYICVIPKGAKYYYSSYDKEYVSTSIKIIKHVRGK